MKISVIDSIDVHHLRRARHRLYAAVDEHTIILPHPHLVPAFPPWDIGGSVWQKGW